IRLTEETVERGELRRFSRKELGTSGLVSPKSKITVDRMREAAVEAGYIDEDMTLSEFLDFIEYEGRDALAMGGQDAAADSEVDAYLEEQMPEEELREKERQERFERLVAKHGFTEATLIRFRQRKGWAFAELRQLAKAGELWTGQNGEWQKTVQNLL